MLGRGNDSSKISLLAICRFMLDIMVRAEPPECAWGHERDNSMKMQSRVLDQSLATVSGWRRLFQPGRREPAGQKVCSKTIFMAEIRREAPVKRYPRSGP